MNLAAPRPKASAFLRLAALALLVLGVAPGLASGETVRTQACPLASTMTGRPDPAHWMSPPVANKDDKARHPCNSCADPANASLKTCAIYRFLGSEACADGHCTDGEGEFALKSIGGREFFLQYDMRYRNPQRFPKARGENCRFLVWATEPVIGIEDANAYAGRNYWLDAYLASQTLIEPPFSRDDLALAIQPPTMRGQHQFHIHIGTLLPAYKAVLAGLDHSTTRLTVHRYDFLARFIAVQPGKTPFEGIDISAIVRTMLPGGSADMPRYGILAAVTEGGTGIWVLAAEHFERAELNYRQKEACRLR